MTVGLDPTGIVSHPDEFHRGQSWKRYCRVATTGNVSIATALNAGDTIDGVVLAAGDRVLVKNQTTGAENGIYLAGTTPIRDFDMDQDLTSDTPQDEALGAVIAVIAGTANGGTLWRCTNTTVPVLGTTALTFAVVFGSGAVALDDLSDVVISSPVNADRLRYDGSTWRNSALVWEVMIAPDGTVMTDGLLNPMQHEVAY